MNLALIALSTTLLAPAQDFSDVANRKEFFNTVKLTTEHKAALAKNQFFTCPSDQETLFHGYAINDYLKIPSFVTADNLLQIYHIFFDSTLRTVEENHCLRDLEALNAGMLAEAKKELQRSKGTTLESAARKNLAYFGVAEALLKKKVDLPADVQSLMTAELAKIKAHAGFTRSAIFPYNIDYSQFIVRGHYTRNAELSRYFEAMMWFGLVPLAVAKRDNQVVTPLPEQIRMASLMALNLKDSGVEARWNKIYNFSSLYAGLSNRLTPKEWREVLAKTYASGDAHNGRADDSSLTLLAQNAIHARPPAYQTMVNEQTVASDVQMRFMGQRALPDGYMITQVVEPQKRPFPNPLDVMAILGSSRASQILDANPKVSNPRGWTSYSSNRKRTQQYFASVDPQRWGQDLYWSWLDTLRKAVAPMPAAAPSVLKSAAWNDRRLSSALASWAELRHDTILYGEQTVAEMGDGEEPQPILRGYIEPDVPLYERIQKMVTQLANALKSSGYFLTEYKDQFQEFDKLLDFFITVSKKELAGKKLSREAHDRIRKIEGVLGYLNTRVQIVGTKYATLNSDDYDMALVADVHTAEGKALTVAVGRSDDLVAIVPIEGKKYLARGTVLSYHEWLQPVAARMTDQQWKKLLRERQTKPRPFWVSSFFVNKKLDYKK